MPTVVALGAHHDDVEVRAGGTLARYAAEGWTVVYVVVTTTPYYCPWPDEVAAGRFKSNEDVIAMRKAEARRGAEILGASSVHFFDFKSQYWYEAGDPKLHYLDGHDTTIEDFRRLSEDLPGRKEFISTAAQCQAAIDFLSGFLAEHQADLVLTHVPDDGHWEHYATANFAARSVRQLARSGRAPRLYAWEQGSLGNLTTSFAPTHFVDISTSIDRKCEALLSFPSQFPDHDSSHFADEARVRARAYGKLIGVEYAEPFMAFQVPMVGQGELVLPATYDVGRAIIGL